MSKDIRDLNMNKIFGESHPFSYQVRSCSDPIKEVVYKQIIEGEITNTINIIIEKEEEIKELKKRLIDLQNMRWLYGILWNN